MGLWRWKPVGLSLSSSLSLDVSLESEASQNHIGVTVIMLTALMKAQGKESTSVVLLECLEIELLRNSTGAWGLTPGA